MRLKKACPHPFLGGVTKERLVIHATPCKYYSAIVLSMKENPLRHFDLRQPERMPFVMPFSPYHHPQEPQSNLGAGYYVP